MTKLVASVWGKRIEDVLRAARDSFRIVDLVEVRLDHLGDPREILGAVDRLECSRTIFTFRSGSEWGAGGELGPEEVRLLASLAERCKSSLIDLEIEKIKRLREARKLAESLGARVIASKHISGSSYEELRESYGEAAKLGVKGYIKLVCYANSVEDNIAPLKLYAAYGAKRLISFCAGEKGVMSRVLAIVAGSPLMYVSPPGGGAVAEGQLTAGFAAELIAVLNQILKFTSTAR